MKGFSIALLAIMILVGNFFIILLSMASNNNRSISDEWKSWWTTEETVKTEDNPLDVEVTLPGEIVPEETT